MASNKNIIKNKTFQISGVVRMEVSLEVEAENFDDALSKAKELNELDFVSCNGDYLDGELEGITFIGSYASPERLKK